jgi:hypothetical protein
LHRSSFALAYLGGVLTILSPCILPVPPFVFARAGRSFVGSVLPMLVGMAATFAAPAAVGGGCAVAADEFVCLDLANARAACRAGGFSPSARRARCRDLDAWLMPVIVEIEHGL